jgi:hypothetical protein
MKTLPIILGLGAIVLIGSKSSKQNEPKKIMRLSLDNIKKIPEETNPLTCKSTEYLNKEGVCQTFWDDNTPGLVKIEIDKQLLDFKLNKSELCDQKDSGDGKGIVENPNHVKITINVITKLWKQIKASELPPTIKSPIYIIELWKKVTNVYYDKVCGIADLPPIT